MICALRRRVLHPSRFLIPVTALAVLLSCYTAVILHASDGDLDPTFGDGGKVTLDFIYDGDISMADEAHAVAIQADGKIVTAGLGDFNNYVSILPVARTNPDGSPDLTFGNGGQLVGDFGLRYHEAYAAAIQPDGKVVIAGTAVHWPFQFLLVRYNSDGSLDAGFGDGGVVLTGHRLRIAEALALQTDGKIVLAGVGGRDSSFALARYNPDGSLDPTFGGGDGRVVSRIGDADSMISRVMDLAVQPDGRILAAGVWANDFVLARYNPDGSLDTTFSDDGIVTTDFGGEDAARAVAVQADGTILVTGEAITPVSGSDFALARYNADGTLDATFGVGGLITTDFGGADDARDMALQADGKIVVAGTSFLAGGETGSDIAVARYEADGTLDPTFGIGGLVTTDIAGPGDAGNAVAIQANGKIVVAGTTNVREPSYWDS